jgi:hypothetical protein
VDTIVSFMPDDGEEWMNYRGVRELHGKTPETARNWALTVVEEIVERKIRGRCWPVPVRDGSSHGQGWAFDSLLGAMWLQMLWLMLGQPHRCEWCGALLDVDPEREQNLYADADGLRKRRSDKRFCSDKGTKNSSKCRQKWNYYNGSGKSSKHAKKRARQEQR